MASTSYYEMTESALEETADIIKCAVITALSRDGTITEDKAEEWAENHTVIMRKKSFFRTISDKFKNIDSDGKGKYWIVVRKI